METCAQCNIELPARQDGIDNGCPTCGCTSRRAFERVEERLVAHQSVRMKVVKDWLRSGKKVRTEAFDGVEHSLKYGKLVGKTRVIDRDGDKYVERITDLQTGEILHECVEPLSNHRGHGTAKPKP
jgi:hypothetical protein